MVIVVVISVHKGLHVPTLVYWGMSYNKERTSNPTTHTQVVQHDGMEWLLLIDKVTTYLYRNAHTYLLLSPLRLVAKDLTN